MNIANDLQEYLQNYPTDSASIPGKRRAAEETKNKEFVKNVLKEMVTLRNPIKAYKREFQKEKKKVTDALAEDSDVSIDSLQSVEEGKDLIKVDRETELYAKIKGFY